MADLQRLEVSFLTSAPSLRKCPPPQGPEVAFAGRSNAGKSSVLNRLTGSRQTARVSKTPGRTQLLNFFAVREGGCLVDLPGYGYAKAQKSTQAAWQESVNEYLSYRENLVAVVLVMDIRHPLQPFDTHLLDWAHDSGIPMRVLLNKADKLKHGARQNTLRNVQQKLAGNPFAQVQSFSATSGLGQAELLATLVDWLVGQPGSAAD